MKTQKQKKAGFTLVELMVVAIIVAILAAVAIPMMTGNKDRAMATEAQGACGAIATQYKLYWVENGSAPSSIDDLSGFSSATTGTGDSAVTTGDLDGTYFAHSDYSLTDTTSANTFEITATSSRTGDANGGTVIMTVTDGQTVWTGTLLD